MNIHIKHKSRLANFLIQIRNALHIALFYKFNVILPSHEYLNSTYIINNKNITRKSKTIVDKHDYFYSDKINIPKYIFNVNKDMVVDVMKNIFVIKNTPSLGVNDLVIHIRSGDIFQEQIPHPEYLTPPLSYYTYIIDKNNYENIYLVAEDTLNPCINKLLELYPNIRFKIQSLKEDIKIILSAVNMVISFGTFIPELLYLSDNIKNVYCPSYCPDYCRYRNEKSNIYILDLNEYYNHMFPWKNTPEQRIQMIEYKI